MSTDRNSTYKNYNPDILETIANLSNDEVFTPPELANEILDLFPEEVWSNPNLTFLDPAVKTGIFLREIASRLIDGLVDQIPDLQERVNHILTKQVFGIGITELTTLMARRTVYCSTTANGEFSICTEFDDEEGNIVFPDTEHAWAKNGRCEICGANKDSYGGGANRENYAYPFIHDNFEKEFGNMKFDVIIGNPPYQLGDGSESISLYDKFIEKADSLNPRYISMIIPARWYTGGRGLTDFRNRMIDKEDVVELHDFKNPADCFKEVGISGGVCYFLIDKKHRGPATIYNHYGNKITSKSKRKLKEENLSFFIRDNIALEIHNKVKIKKEGKFSSIVSVQTPFGLKSSFNEYEKDMNKKSKNVKIYIRGKQSRYIQREQVLKNQELIDKYKVYVSKSYSITEAYQQRIMNVPFVGEPNTCCSQTYLAIGPFENENQTSNVVSYMKTKFFRFMLSIIKNSQDNMRETFSLVPLQDFSKSWADEELYKKYKLTQEEIDYIEDNIAPMPTSDD